MTEEYEGENITGRHRNIEFNYNKNMDFRLKPFVRLGKKYYTVKAWNKFCYPAQQILLKKFDVILIDHQTRSEKARAFLLKFNQKNLNKGIKVIDKFSKDIDKMLKPLGSKRR